MRVGWLDAVVRRVGRVPVCVVSLTTIISIGVKRIRTTFPFALIVRAIAIWILISILYIGISTETIFPLIRVTIPVPIARTLDME